MHSYTQSSIYTFGSQLNFFSPSAPPPTFPPLFLLLSSFSSCPCCSCPLAPSSISSIYNGASRGGKDRTSTRPSCYPPLHLNLSVLILKIIPQSLSPSITTNLATSPAFLPSGSAPQPHRTHVSNLSLTSWLCCYGDGCP